MDFTAVDFVEYIPRPVVDQQADQGLESKTDMKKKGSVKRTPQPKPAQPIPESLVNEFGITSKAMKAFEVCGCQVDLASTFKRQRLTEFSINYLCRHRT